MNNNLKAIINDNGQRLDNFLFKKFKNIPKSVIYKAIRTGQIRVNSKRKKAHDKLSLNDEIRFPPHFLADATKVKNIKPSAKIISQLNDSVLFENDDLIIINKPYGIPVHAGNKVQWGIIEAMRYQQQNSGDDSNLDLVHRIDKATSGCLMISKNRKSLLYLQDLMLKNKITKKYLLLSKGKCLQKNIVVNKPLEKKTSSKDEHEIIVSQNGKEAKTVFNLIESINNTSLFQATLFTGRMHQIRVHASSENHPLAGDIKYGNFLWNRELQHKYNFNRMFLHALSVFIPGIGEIYAKLDTSLQELLINLGYKHIGEYCE